MKEDYEIVENEEGKREFVIESGNKTYSLTKEELEDMYVPTDPSVGTKYFEIRDKLAGTKDLIETVSSLWSKAIYQQILMV